MFQPIAGVDDGVELSSRPHVLPSYLGALLTLEFVGTEEGNVIGELGVDSKTISSYGVWSREGELLRVALVNSELHLTGNSTATNNAQRNSTTVNLVGAFGPDPKGFTLKRLSIPSITAHAGM